MKMIRVRVSKDGKTTEVETSGYAGQECMTATRRLEEALGRVTLDTTKAEMMDVPETVES